VLRDVRPRDLSVTFDTGSSHWLSEPGRADRDSRTGVRLSRLRRDQPLRPSWSLAVSAPSRRELPVEFVERRRAEAAADVAPHAEPAVAWYRAAIRGLTVVSLRSWRHAGRIPPESSSRPVRHDGAGDDGRSRLCGL